MSEQPPNKVIGHLFNIREGRASFETIRKRVSAGARMDGIHIWSLIAAMTIASIGLNLDSTEAIIGAMLICPLMGSVVAIAYSVASVDSKLLRESVAGLAAQVAVCLATSTLYFTLSPLSNTTSELLTNSTATIWDLIIAFVGGFAGGIGNSRRQEPATLIAGVAVATALMPPLCSVGYGIAARDLALAMAAFYKFLINVVFIAFGAEVVLVWLRVPVRQDLDGDGVVSEAELAEVQMLSKTMRRRLAVGSLLLAIPCVFISAQVIRTTMAENGTLFDVHDAYDTEMTTLELGAICPELTEYRIGTEDSYDRARATLVQRVVATVETSVELSSERQKQLEALIRLHVANLDTVSFEVAAAS